MEAISLQEDFFSIGISCCISDPATTVGSQRIEYTKAEQTTVLLKQPVPRIRLSSIMSPILRRNYEDLMPSFDSSTIKRIDENDGDDRYDSHPPSNSVAGCVSTTRAAQLVMGNAYFGQGPSPVLGSMPSLLNSDEGDCDCGVINSQEEDVTDTTCSESCHSAHSVEDALAVEVGLTAHEYLEECFYTEVSILNREKFNAIPEIVKSDFTIAGHLGKGSFSDVFEVIFKDGQLATKMNSTTQMSSNATQMRSSATKMSSATKLSSVATDDTQPNRRRPSRGRRTTLSCSINIATLARPPKLDKCQNVFAMKCLRPQIRCDAEQFTIGAEDLVHETAILANLNHPNIIKVHGRASGKLTDAFVLNDGYFILLDRLSETLQDRIDAWKQNPKCTFQGPTVQQIEVARSIANAVSYLHSKKIVFRDLKPDNVGFDSKGVLKLFDFGFAIGLPEKDASNPAGFLFDRCGTPRYMAPEVGLSLGYGLKADVYSFGILLWEVCALVKPFSHVTSSGEFERSVFMGGRRPIVKNYWPTAVKEIMSRCWSASPSRRPTMLDIQSSLSLPMTNGNGEKKALLKTGRPRMAQRSSTDTGLR